MRVKDIPYNMFVGLPGSGKSVHIKIVNKIMGENIHKVATGEIFRDEIARQTKFGREIENIMNSGGLVNDKQTIDIVKSRLLPRHTHLDGFPRNRVQGKWLLEYIDSRHGEITPLFFHLEIDEKLATERLLARGRGDDNKNTIKKRIEIAKSHTLPLIAYLYQKNIPTLRIDANLDLGFGDTKNTPITDMNLRNRELEIAQFYVDSLWPKVL